MSLTHSITKKNELFYAGAVVVTNCLRVNINKAAQRKELMWRRRLQNTIKEPGRIKSVKIIKRSGNSSCEALGEIRKKMQY